MNPGGNGPRIDTRAAFAYAGTNISEESVMSKKEKTPDRCSTCGKIIQPDEPVVRLGFGTVAHAHCVPERTLYPSLAEVRPATDEERE